MLLAWVSAAFVSGIALGTWWAPSAKPVVLCALVFALLAAVPRVRRIRVVLVLGVALCAGLWRAPHTPLSPGGSLGSLNGSWVEVHGVVSAEPDVRDTGSNYVITADTAGSGSRSFHVSGKLLLHTSASVQLEYGDEVVLTGRVLEPRSGAVPYAAILARQGIASEMRYPRVVDRGPRSMGWLGWVVPLREKIEAGINAWLPEPEAALLIAITLGAKSASLGNIAPVLIATGLIHVIAISGIKVALVAGTLYELARTLRNRLLSLLVALSCLALYVLLTGATVSGERSAFMWCLVFIAAYLGRRTVALCSLAAAAAVMACVDPYLLGDIGFQLSTVGTFSIVALTEPLVHLCRRVPSPLREAFCVTVAAQIGTFPIVIFGFHVLSLTGPLANALVLPLLPVLIVLGFVLGMIASAAPLAAPLAACAFALSHAVIQTAQWLSSFPGALPVRVLSPGIVTSYYVALALVTWTTLRRAHWVPVGQWTARSTELLSGFALALALVTTSVLRADASASPRLYWLGTDDALLLRGERFTALIGGSHHPFALLEQMAQVLPYGVRDIDLMVVTDPRPGQILGLRAVLDHYRVHTVWETGAVYPSTTYAAWRRAVRARRIPAFALRTGGFLRTRDITLTALGPDAVYPKVQDCVGLIRIRGSRHSILVAGTADSREQHEAVFRAIGLRADTLLLDGSAGLDTAFVRSVDPAILWVRHRTSSTRRQRLLPSGATQRFDL